MLLPTRIVNKLEACAILIGVSAETIATPLYPPLMYMTCTPTVYLIYGVCILYYLNRQLRLIYYSIYAIFQRSYIVNTSLSIKLFRDLWQFYILNSIITSLV